MPQLRNDVFSGHDHSSSLCRKSKRADCTVIHIHKNNAAAKSRKATPAAPGHMLSTSAAMAVTAVYATLPHRFWMASLRANAIQASTKKTNDRMNPMPCAVEWYVKVAGEPSGVPGGKP